MSSERKLREASEKRSRRKTSDAIEEKKIKNGKITYAVYPVGMRGVRPLASVTGDIGCGGYRQATSIRGGAYICGIMRELMRREKSESSLRYASEPIYALVHIT